MKDLQKARTILENGDYTCVLCKGDTVYTDKRSGISPVLDLISKGVDLNGFSVADKVVGRAAAMLFIQAGIKHVFAQVMSRPAVVMLNCYDITFSCNKITDNIINRARTGLCPMESAVKDIHEPEVAFAAIKLKMHEMGWAQYAE